MRLPTCKYHLCEKICRLMFASAFMCGYYCKAGCGVCYCRVMWCDSEWEKCLQVFMCSLHIMSINQRKRFVFVLIINLCSYRSDKVPELQLKLRLPIVAHPQSTGSTHKSTSCCRYCFSNIHIFHDVHQYNKTLIDLHYNYFMYFRFSFSLLSLESTLLCV